MQVTRQMVADQIVSYLHGRGSLPQLVDWAEREIMTASSSRPPFAMRSHGWAWRMCGPLV